MDQLPIDINLCVIACDIDHLINLLIFGGFTEQAKAVRMQFENQITEIGRAHV